MSAHTAPEEEYDAGRRNDMPREGVRSEDHGLGWRPLVPGALDRDTACPAHREKYEAIWRKFAEECRRLGVPVG